MAKIIKCTKPKVPKKTNKKFINSFKINEIEIISILNYLKKINDEQNILIFYLLLIKGFNFTTISRINLYNFKKGFHYLIVKKGKNTKYKISLNIREKFIEFMRKQNYENTFFLQYNKR